MVVIESQFLPPIAVFHQAVLSKTLMIELHENYQKKSFRNKCHVLSSDGVYKFSVPLHKGKNNHCPIQQVMIYDEFNWKVSFLKSLKTCYSNSPYYPHYIDNFIELINVSYQRLTELNFSLLTWIIEEFQLDITLACTSSFISNYSDPIKDWRNKTMTFYYDYSSKHGKKYPQVFEDKNGFQYGLSIIDLIFNLGPETKSYLSK